jgi:hypothetical protein
MSEPPVDSEQTLPSTGRGIDVAGWPVNTQHESRWMRMTPPAHFAFTSFERSALIAGARNHRRSAANLADRTVLNAESSAHAHI